uniref:Uncharacterized protein n=1 Tax=Chenopodium quinoa TaxID=63459 RepID=A0A803LLV5_CHEQI
MTPAFNVRDTISKIDKYVVRLMVEEIKGKLLAIPLDEVHKLDQELIEAFQYIRAKKIDSSSFEQSKISYVEEATLASLVSDLEHQFAECTKKVNDLKMSHTSLEQSVSAIKEAQSKLSEVEKIYDTRRDALKTLDWTP